MCNQLSCRERMRLHRRAFVSLLAGAGIVGGKAFTNDRSGGNQTLYGGNDSALADEWQTIASETDGLVGAAALDVFSGRHATLNGEGLFPLASVCKLPIAMRALQLVDEKSLALDGTIEILERDVWRSWEGDVGHNWPQKRSAKLSELIRLMVAESDNTAVHTLFRVVGEQPGMAGSFRQWQIQGIRVDRYEGQCALAAHGGHDSFPMAAWKPGLTSQLIAEIPIDVQYRAMRRFIADRRDTATPSDTAQLLCRLFNKHLLSAQSTGFLVEVLKETTTGKRRIRAELPRDVEVAHKTGTTDTIKGFNGATNDVGLIMKKGVRPLALAVYIRGSSRSEEVRERVIAEIAKATYTRWLAPE